MTTPDDAPRLARLCVFCGANTGHDPAHRVAAEGLGTLLGRTGRTLVFGGGRVGLMGAIADATLAAGGHAIGVIPQALVAREVGHTGLTSLHVVDTMHERKATMAALADAFVMLPGGLGTLEELFEIWTWGMLGLHHKPYGVLNVGGYFDPLLAFLDRAVDAGFVRAAQRAELVVDTDASALLTTLEARIRTP
jgi:uncharacterized protein (TIGR00730 family)